MLFRVFKRKENRSPSVLTVHCRECDSELPVMAEQRERLAAGNPVWLFCPLCRRIVSGKAHVTKRTSVLSGH